VLGRAQTRRLQTRRLVKAATNTLTRSFIGRSKRRSETGDDPPDEGATAMTDPTAPHKPHPSAWAVGLFVLSTAFALISLALFSTGYSPL